MFSRCKKFYTCVVGTGVLDCPFICVGTGVTPTGVLRPLYFRLIRLLFAAENSPFLSLQDFKEVFSVFRRISPKHLKKYCLFLPYMI